MKKFISIALVLVMIFAVSLPTFATDITKDTGSKGTTIKTLTWIDENGNGEKDPGEPDVENYLVSIPADTKIAWSKVDSKTNLKYTVESHLMAGKKLNVKVTGNGKMTDINDLANTIPYTLSAITSNALDYTTAGPVSYDTVNGKGVEVEFTVDILGNDWNTAVVSEYKDTLTFTASIVVE